MIYLFHGENQPALRDALLELKKGYEEAVFWEKDLPVAHLPDGQGKGGFAELSMYLASPTLFSQKSLPAGRRELVIIEEPPLAELSKLMELIKAGDKDVALIFAEKIPPEKLPHDRQLKILYFREEVPKNAFPFLDALVAKDRKKAFAQAHRLIKSGEDVHFLLTMVVWQMRNLAKVKGKVKKGFHPYVLEKLQRLERNFTEEELACAFSLLLKEDLNIKKGKGDAVTFDLLIRKLTS
ncbi:hypothetical protein COT70_00295 [candidate division WWE3 bacterium CG09_land_8_20_14_0_10_47_33]|uniref:DNA-directed DNA polymerase n=1 Tax=candidate division WWE3 bacterium CG_4_9_14_0_2_um_filter_48_10 TaxID=1975078 RepID=A0A2M8EK92_UNCKA|nr:MAG: hypothetical protein COT70_00295 [candidate division WWE3 bacterium CG09_land_8_20_14_0_10_47_33]PJC23166.1 MAG: hypothetical protein CO059_00365 [candidate division WWE3 bacterium CG_4_9_14_0_2_um_filter_48_10]PJE51633.1 MAG: hypothetical protein COV28_02095 [candidate division WWE3 bacterium CG10_big_fil_rev_8_21_14_0_10_48_23]